MKKKPTKTAEKKLFPGLEQYAPTERKNKISKAVVISGFLQIKWKIVMLYCALATCVPHPFHLLTDNSNPPERSALLQLFSYALTKFSLIISPILSAMLLPH